MNINKLIIYAKKTLETKTETPRLDAEILLSYILNKPKSYLYTWPEVWVSEEKCKNYINLIEKRKSGIPVAYLIGQAEFWGIPLKVTSDTLIPRGDTEILIESILQDYPDTSQALSILDLGTGSGAIAVTLGSIYKNANIIATDINIRALNIAQLNAFKNKILNIKFMLSDWFSSISFSYQFDIIVSNPPYISLDDKEVELNVRKHEPNEALFSKENGLFDIKKIIKKSNSFLKKKGAIYLEHGYQQGELVQKILSDRKFYNIKRYYDLAKNWRVTSAVR